MPPTKFLKGGKSMRAFGVSMILAFMICAVALAHESGYVYEAMRTKNPPKIDGKLDDLVWKLAPSVRLENINTGGKVKEEYVSLAWAVYDDTHIYVAFKNGEPNPKKITTVSPGHDKSVWKDDENELFIEPNHAGSKPYFHIMINAANVTQDDENGGAEGAWEPKSLKSATSIGDDHWVLELKIAFADLNVKEVPTGKTWGWNFNRHIVSGVDIWTGWSETGPSFHTPTRFGDLIFSEETLSVSPKGKLTISWGRVKLAQ